MKDEDESGWFTVPHRAGTNAIHELARHLYPSINDPFREMIANSIDEKSPYEHIEVLPQRISCEDWGEGIKNVPEFTKFGERTKLDKEAIGEKGMGKLSALAFSDTVRFLTNNGEVDTTIIMHPDVQEGFKISPSKPKGTYLSHQGTKIIIENPERIPACDDLKKFLIRVFGLRLAQGHEIILNGEALQSRLRMEESFLFSLEDGVKVSGNLWQSSAKGSGNVDLHIKHIFVRSITINPDRAFDGWVNCDELEPSTNRNDISPFDPHYSDFLIKLRFYVERFPRRGEEITNKDLKLGTSVTKLFVNCLREMKLFPEGVIPLGKGAEDTNVRLREKPSERQKPSEPHEEGLEKPIIHRASPINRIIRRERKTRYGIIEQYTSDGNDKTPVYFVYPNLLVYNTTNDLYKFCSWEKSSLGSQAVRLLPFVARAVVELKIAYGKSERMEWEEFEKESDEALRVMLRAHGLLFSSRMTLAS